MIWRLPSLMKLLWESFWCCLILSRPEQLFSQIFQFSPTLSQILSIDNAVNKLLEDFVLEWLNFHFIFKENYCPTVHEITASHDFMSDQQDSLSASHNDRQVFKIQSYKEDRFKLRVISRKYRLPDMMSRIRKISISGAVLINVRCFFGNWRGLIFNKFFPRLNHTYCIDKILQVLFSKTWQPCDLPRTLIRTSQSEDIKDYFNQVIFPIESGNVASRISEWQYFNFCLRLPLIYEWFLFFQSFFLIFVCPAPSDQLYLDSCI